MSLSSIKALTDALNGARTQRAQLGFQLLPLREAIKMIGSGDIDFIMAKALASVMSACASANSSANTSVAVIPSVAIAANNKAAFTAPNGSAGRWFTYTDSIGGAKSAPRVTNVSRLALNRNSIKDLLSSATNNESIKAGTTDVIPSSIGAVIVRLRCDGVVKLSDNHKNGYLKKAGLRSRMRSKLGISTDNIVSSITAKLSTSEKSQISVRRFAYLSGIGNDSAAYRLNECLVISDKNVSGLSAFLNSLPSSCEITVWHEQWYDYDAQIVETATSLSNPVDTIFDGNTAKYIRPQAYKWVTGNNPTLAHGAQFDWVMYSQRYQASDPAYGNLFTYGNGESDTRTISNGLMNLVKSELSSYDTVI